MAEKYPHAESAFRSAKGARSAKDVPNWKAIRDEEDKRRNQIFAKLRTARLAQEAALAAAQTKVPSVPVRAVRHRNKNKKKS